MRPLLAAIVSLFVAGTAAAQGGIPGLIPRLFSELPACTPALAVSASGTQYVLDHDGSSSACNGDGNGSTPIWCNCNGSIWVSDSLAGTGSPHEQFIQHTDTPGSYAGQEGKFTAVNGTGNGLEFVDPPTGGSEVRVNGDVVANPDFGGTPGEPAPPAGFVATTWGYLTTMVAAYYRDWTQDQGATEIHEGNIPATVTRDAEVPGLEQDNAALADITNHKNDTGDPHAAANANAGYETGGAVATHAGDAGDPHSAAGYLKTFTESDPRLPAPATAGQMLVTLDGTNWTLLPVLWQVTTTNCKSDPNGGKLTIVDNAGTDEIRCAGDQVTGGGTGITSLNGLVAATQLFADVDDSNVALDVSSVTDTHTITVSWVGQLPLSRLTRECSALEAIMGSGAAASPVCVDVLTQAEFAATEASLFASGDKAKLDGVEAGAQVNTVTAVFGLTGAVDIDSLTENLTPPSNAVVAIERGPGVFEKVQLGNLPGGGGSSTFLGLTDTPSVYTGQGSKLVGVNSGETGLEFTPIEADSSFVGFRLEGVNAGGVGVPGANQLYLVPCESPGGEWCKRDSGDADETQMLTTATGSQPGHTHTESDVTDLAHLTVQASGGTDSTQAIHGQDARLSDARAPTAHTHPFGEVDSVPTDRILGRDSVGTGVTEALTAAQVRAITNTDEVGTARPPTAHALGTAGGFHTGTLPESDILFPANDGSRHDHTEVDVTDLAHASSPIDVIAASLATGLYSGGVLSAGTDPDTQVDVADGSGLIVNDLDYSNVTAISIANWGAQTITLTAPELAASAIYYLYIDNTGTFVKSTTNTRAEGRASIFLGAVTVNTVAGTIEGVVTAPDLLEAPAQDLRDEHVANGGVRVFSGLVVSEGALAMTLQHTAGVFYGLGIGRVQNPNEPNKISASAADPITFDIVTADGTTATGGDDVTLIDPTIYDPLGAGGQPTTVPNPPASTTIQYLFYIPGGQFYIQLGQTVYGSVAEAEIALQSDARDFIVAPQLVDIGMAFAAVIVPKSATDLDVDGKVIALSGGRLGTSGGGTGGGGDVFGPGAAGLNETAVFADTTGKLLKTLGASSAWCDPLTDPTGFANPRLYWDDPNDCLDWFDQPAAGSAVDVYDKEALVAAQVTAQHFNAGFSATQRSPGVADIGPATGPSGMTQVGVQVDGCTVNAGTGQSETSNVICNTVTGAQRITGGTHFGMDVPFDPQGGYLAGSDHEPWASFTASSAQGGCAGGYTALGLGTDATWSSSYGFTKKHGDDLHVMVGGVLSSPGTGTEFLYGACLPNGLVTADIVIERENQPIGSCSVTVSGGSIRYALEVLHWSDIAATQIKYSIGIQAALNAAPILDNVDPAVPHTWAVGDAIDCKYRVRLANP